MKGNNSAFIFMRGNMKRMRFSSACIKNNIIMHFTTIDQNVSQIAQKRRPKFKFMITAL